MKLANCKTMSHFFRKYVLEKEIYIVDLEPFRDLQWLLSNTTNNINQIAKATNIMWVIYKKEIDYMRENRKFVKRNMGYTFPIIKEEIRYISL